MWKLRSHNTNALILFISLWDFAVSNLWLFILCCPGFEINHIDIGFQLNLLQCWTPTINACENAWRSSCLLLGLLHYDVYWVLDDQVICFMEFCNLLRLHERSLRPEKNSHDDSVQFIKYDAAEIYVCQKLCIWSLNFETDLEKTTFCWWLYHVLCKCKMLCFEPSRNQCSPGRVFFL